ncbi:MAG: GIY-YIG nuclease family protein [Maricaulaceae bacterium]
MFFVYIVTNRRDGVLYTGHTDDLSRRAYEHSVKAYKGFSARYNCTRLVWFECHETREVAFRRERQIKSWKRRWKINTIERLNPDWHDLYASLTEANVYASERLYRPHAYLSHPPI